jgi:argininosuccinate lyase
MLDTKIDFRAAHAVVGCLVSRLEKQARSLADATPEDVAAAAAEMTGQPIAIESKILARSIEPMAAIAARNGHGGCAPEEVHAMAEALSRDLKSHLSWIHSVRDKQRRALDRLLEEAHAFAGVGR